MEKLRKGFAARILSWALILTLALPPLSVWAAEKEPENVSENAFEEAAGTMEPMEPDSGREPASWDYEEDSGKLVIHGPGAVEDCGDSSDAPWYGLEVTDLIVEDGVTYLGSRGFADCASLAAVYFQGDAPEIDPEAFWQVTADVYYPEGNPAWQEKAGADYGGKLIWKALKEAGDDAVSQSENQSPEPAPVNEEIKAPEELGDPEDPAEEHQPEENRAKEDLSGDCGKNVSWSYDETAQTLYISGKGPMDDYDLDRMASYYQWGNSVKKVVIEEGVTHIGNFAFRSFPAVDFQIAPSVKSIGDKAFWLSRLTGLVIPEGVTSIGSGAFKTSDLESVIIPDSVTRIGSFAFDGCYRLTEAHIGKKVCSIGMCPFGGDENLTGISVDPDNAFYKDEDGVLLNKAGTSLVQFPAGKTQDTYKIPEGVRTVESWAFNRYQGTAVEIPATVTQIEEDAFYWSPSLTSVQIPYSVTSIRSGAFVNCRNLTEIYFHGDAPQMRSEYTTEDGYNIFEGVTATAYYPKGNTTWSLSVRTQYGGDLSWKTWTSFDPAPERTPISKCSITLSRDMYTYSGSANRPSVTVEDGSKKLAQDVDYTVSYSDNINASDSAKVTVTGIGGYMGTAVKTFIIYKRYQALTASISATSIKAKETARITASAVGPLSYRSDSPKVATVSPSGVVKGIGVGSAEITVTAGETDNYYRTKETFTVTVTSNAVFAPVNVDSLTYNFSNSAYSFGYKSGYRIPLKIYQVVFSDRQAEQQHENSGSWGGSCYGMSSTSSMFNTPNSTLLPSQFKSSAKRVSALSVSDRSSSLDLNVKELIEAVQVSQGASSIQAAYSQNRDLNELCRRAKEVESGSPPVIVGIWGQGSSGGGKSGHAIVAYKTKKINNSTTYVYVYDCNYPGQERYITVTTDSAGSCTGWSYPIDSSRTWGSGRRYSGIAYVPYTDYQSVWAGRQANLTTEVNTLVASTDDFAIQDLEGNTLAVMSEGKLSSKTEDIYPGRMTDEGENGDSGHIIYMPTDAYRIVNKDPASPEFELSMVNVDQSAEVTTQSDAVEIYLDDSQEVNLVSIDASKGETYEVSMTSELDCAGDQGQIGYSGAGGLVTVGTSAGQCVMEGYQSTGMTVNGENVNVTNADYEREIDKCAVSLASSSFTYNGKSAAPEVTVKDGAAALIEEKDYVVICKNNTQAGRATATVYGIGKYKGQKELSFTIEKLDLSDCTADLSESTYMYDGEEKRPYVLLKKGTVALQEGVDYTVEYRNNKNPGTATATITGKGSCGGTIRKTFAIKADPDFQVNLSDCAVTLKTSRYVHDGRARTPEVTVTDSDGVRLESGTDYTVVYKNNKMPGTASAVITGRGIYAGTVTKTFRILLATPGKPRLSNTAKGIKLNWTAVKGASGYCVYRKDKKSSGWRSIKTLGNVLSCTDTTARSNGMKYTYAIQAYYKSGGGNMEKSSYNSSGRDIYYISPPAAPGLKNAKGRKLTATWKKNGCATGYQVQYSTKSSFAGAVTKNVSKQKRSLQIRGLQKKKRYYVRVRSYKKQSGAAYYSPWSAARRITISK